MDSSSHIAVIPILPAVQSLVVVLTLCGSGLIAGLWALRHPRAWGALVSFLWSQKWSLATLAAVGGLGIAALGWLTTSEPVEDGPPVPATGWWPQRGGDGRHGVMADSPTPTDGTVQWVGGIGHTFFASPAVVGDRIYNIGFQGDRGRLFCWNAHSGEQLWTSTLAGIRATFSSPVIVGHRLLIGEGLHHTPDASVYCVDLRAGREGSILWKFQTRSHVECTPLVADETVYVAAGDDGLYALGLDASDSGEAVLRWHVPADRAPDVETALCHHDGRLIVGTGRDGGPLGKALLVLDASTGEQLARLPMPFPVHGVPSVSVGRLYVGMGSGDYVHYDESRGQVVCVDLATLELQWTFPTEGTVLGAIACDDAGLYFGCTSGRIYALNHDGELIGERDNQAANLASPALAKETILSVNQAGVLSAFDRDGFQVRWAARLGNPGQYISSPIVAHGHVYVGTPDAGLLCLGRPSGNHLDHSAGGHELPGQGEVIWQHSLDGEITAPPGVSRSAIVVPHLLGGIPALTGLSNGGSGAPRQLWQQTVNALVTYAPAVSDELLIVPAVDRLLAMDTLTGQILWDVAEGTQSAPVIDGHRVWVADGDGPYGLWRPLSLIDGRPDGDPTDERPMPRPIKDPKLTVCGGALCLDGHDSELPEVWCDLSALGEILTAPVIDRGRVYVAISGGRIVCVGGTEAE